MRPCPFYVHDVHLFDSSNTLTLDPFTDQNLMKINEPYRIYFLYGSIIFRQTTIPIRIYLHFTKTPQRFSSSAARPRGKSVFRQALEADALS